MGRNSTPTPSRLRLDTSPPFDGGEEGRDARGRLFLSPGQGERWFAQQTGVGVIASLNDVDPENS